MSDAAVGVSDWRYQDDDDGSLLLGDMRNASGVRVSSRTVKQIAVVFACVARKSTSLAQLPLKLYKRKADGSEVATWHPLYDVLYRRPNRFQTSMEFRPQMQGWLELRGNSCAEIVPGARGSVDQLMPMHPDRLWIDRVQGSGDFRYHYDDPIQRKTRVLMQDEVFHLRDLCDDLGIGQSRISAGNSTMGEALGQQHYSMRFLKNDSRPPAVITGIQWKTEENKREWLESWQKGQTGENRGKIGTLPPGADIKILGISPKDAQLLEARQYSDLQLCVLFNMLPALIGIDAGKSATFGSFEQMMLLFGQQSVLPAATIWEQAIERDLITSPDYYARHTLTAMLRADDLARGAFYSDMLDRGVFSQDEVRALEEQNPIPGGFGKHYWMQLNMARIDSEGRPAPGEGDGGAPQSSKSGKLSQQRRLGSGGNGGDDESSAAFQALAEHDLGR